MIHEVQLDMLMEQLRQGLLQLMQVLFTKNLVVSAQERQVFKFVQAKHGVTQGSQVKVVVLA